MKKIVSASPFVFSSLATEIPFHSAQAAARCDELQVRFGQQLERLSDAMPIHNRAGARAMDVLRKMHINTLQTLQNHSDLVTRLRSFGAEEPPKRRFEISDGALFTLMLEDLEGRHAAANETVMEAIQVHSLPRASDFLTMRISTQLLLRHHLDLWGRGKAGNGKQSSGAVVSALPLTSVITAAASEARVLCAAHFHHSPDVKVSEFGSECALVDAPPSYVRYIVLELLKNALRAAMENGGGDVEVEIRCDETKGMATAAILDRGLGVNHSVLETALNRFNDETFSRERLWDRLDQQVSYMPARSPLYGIGVGLALSRLHIEYLGGRLTVQSREGGGTSAILELPISGSHANEGIPLNAGPR